MLNGLTYIKNWVVLMCGLITHNKNLNIKRIKTQQILNDA